MLAWIDDPDRFIEKWKAADLKERAAAHSHFSDLCRLLDEPSPTDADPKGEWYAFERAPPRPPAARAGRTSGSGAASAGSTRAAAVAWTRRSISSSATRWRSRTRRCSSPATSTGSGSWTNAVSARHEFDLDGLREPANRQKLKWAFAEPERLRPGLTRRHVTEIAAERFAGLAKDLRAKDLRAKGHEPQSVAHFVNRLVFCMFAEDIGLLPSAMFTRMLKEA